MIDLHTHVLPGVDDGAQTVEEAVRMCRMATAEGCHTLVATPHQRNEVWWNGDRTGLEERRASLQDTVGESPRVLLGGEVRIDDRILDEVDRLPEGEILTLAGSHYLLLELSRDEGGPDPESLVHELIVGGWHPILAHPEFIPWLAQDLDRLGGLLDQGAYFQVTAMSLTGEFGSGPQSCSTALVDAGLVHFVASDCHSVERRPPGLRKAYQRIEKRWGEDTAWRLTTGNPSAVIKDSPLPAAETC